MALILATTYPDVFAAAGVHSATAYRSATQSFRALSAMAARGRRRATGEMAPVVLIHGTGDQVVRPTNADRIVAQWLTSRDGGALRGSDAGQDRSSRHQDPVVLPARSAGPRVLAGRRPGARLVGRPSRGYIDPTGRRRPRS